MTEQQKKYRQTISNEMLAFWKKHQMYGDVSLLVELTGLSQPMISKALKHGAVFKQKTIDIINDFYKQREDEQQPK